MPINHYLSLVYWEPTRFFLGLEEVLGVLGVVGSECLRVAEVEGVGLQGSSAMTASGVLDLGLWVSGSKTDVAGLAVGDEWVWEGHGFSFHCETLALTPRRYSWRVERRERWAEPSGSLNATTSDEWEPFLRVEGGQTQLGFWVIVREAYAGLWATRERWHSSGIQGRSRVLMGTLLIRILDHLMLALARRPSG